MERKCGQISVEDVYSLASQIGDDFQRLIDSFGTEPISSLMPKVIRVLEHLEMLTLQKDSMDNEVDCLKLSIYQLEHDKHEKAQHQNKFEMELEQIEDNWRKENLHLTQLVDRLTRDNMRLTHSLADKENTIVQSLHELQSHGQMKLDSEMSFKESLIKCEEKIDSLSSEINAKNEEIEKLYNQIESVMQQNRELRRRIKNLQNQLEFLIGENSENGSSLQENYREIQQNLIVPLNDMLDMTSSVDYLREKRPESPSKFTISEIKNIWQERNFLKIRVSELEEELNQTKKSSLNKVTPRRLSMKANLLDVEKSDLPVQGPINREPDDKLFPGRHQNKILRFFPSLSWPRLKLT